MSTASGGKNCHPGGEFWETGTPSWGRVLGTGRWNPRGKFWVVGIPAICCPTKICILYFWENHISAVLQPRHFQLVLSWRGRTGSERALQIIIFLPEITTMGIDEKCLFFLKFINTTHVQVPALKAGPGCVSNFPDESAKHLNQPGFIWVHKSVQLNQYLA